MNSLLVKVIAALFLVMTSTSFAESVDDGGMSGGGGGGTFPGAPVTGTQVAEILKQARMEIYLALAYQSQESTFPWPELFQGPKSIYILIRDNELYLTSGSCHDAFGNPTDGSIHSPEPGTICISVGNLAKKLTTDNARAQILALVVHEYSHLQGFDETKASALQKWFIPVFANSSSGQALNHLDRITRQVMDLSDYLHYLNTKPANELSWDYLCFLAEKIQTALTIIEQQLVDKPFSVFTRVLYTKQNSYLVKQTVITTQVCARSQYHPEKEFQKIAVQRWFKNSDLIHDRDLVDELLTGSKYDVRSNILILGNLPIRRFSTFDDFKTEFADVQKYIYDDLRFHIVQLWNVVGTTGR